MPKLNRVLDAELLEPIWRQVVECPSCLGEGRMEHLTGWSPLDGSPTGWSETCPACNGSGSLEVEVPPLEMDERDEEQVHGH